MSRALKAGGALCLVLVAIRLTAQTTDRGRAEALATRATDRLRALQGEADHLASEERTLLGDLRKLELQRDIATEQLRQASARAEAATAERAAIDDQVKQLDSEQQLDSPQIAQRMVELYKLGGARYLHLLFATPDVRRLGDAARMVAALAAHDQSRVSVYQARLQQLKTSRESLVAREAELTALRAQAEQARASADQAVASRNDLIRRIDRDRDLNAQLTGELQTAQQKLQTTLRQLAAGSSPREAATLPLKPFRGDLDWPVAGQVRQRFGQATRAGRSSGIGIAPSQPGSAVLAVHEGTVAYADTFTGFGRLVIVDHGAQNFSLYGNLTAISARKGAQVARGDTLGTADTNGADEPGLYFELRIDGQPVDPLQWLKAKR